MLALARWHPLPARVLAAELAGRTSSSFNRCFFLGNKQCDFGEDSPHMFLGELFWMFEIHVLVAIFRSGSVKPSMAMVVEHSSMESCCATVDTMRCSDCSLPQRQMGLKFRDEVPNCVLWVGSYFHLFSRISCSCTRFSLILD